MALSTAVVDRATVSRLASVATRTVLVQLIAKLHEWLLEPNK